MLGESTELNAAQDRLSLFGIGAAIVIFLLLQAAFGSLRLAAMTFLLLPMALVGGVLAVKLGDGILSLGSLVGFLTGVRHRRAQRDPDDQPLPAPGSGAGNVGRPAERWARRPAASAISAIVQEGTVGRRRRSLEKRNREITGL